MLSLSVKSKTPLIATFLGGGGGGEEGVNNSPSTERSCALYFVPLYPQLH